ncbi:MAG: hypothetical protein HY043_04820 [Verrucomicrobia bacterium]|nr:hypothetical protein [Verrucomicrobiota bacterium]
MSKVILSFGIGGLASVVLAAVWHSSFAVQEILGPLALPFYLIGIIVSENAHVPNAFATYGSMWLAASFFVWVIMIARSQSSSREDEDQRPCDGE